MKPVHKYTNSLEHNYTSTQAYVLWNLNQLQNGGGGTEVQYGKIVSKPQYPCLPNVHFNQSKNLCKLSDDCRSSP